MPRIKIESIVEEHESDFRRALVDAVEAQLPDADVDGRQLMRDFKRQIGRRFSTWTRVRDAAVDED